MGPPHYYRESRDAHSIEKVYDIFSREWPAATNSIVKQGSPLDPRKRATPAPSRPLVLIVDDLADGREIVADYLQFHGYGVLLAGDGLTAMELARTHLPDVIVMDLALPRVDGFGATRRIKADSATKHIPVVACSAMVSREKEEEALAVGCACYMTKPCSPAAIEAAVRHLLGVRREAADVAVDDDSQAQH